MIEKDIRDRVPTYPGRVLLRPVADQPNYFEFVRADDPTEEGTPLDRATLMSIINSRLTGRYYEPTVQRAADSSRAGLTVSPIPTSGWVYDADNRRKATNGVYTVEASSDQNTSANRVNDVFTSSGWRSTTSVENWIQIYHTQALKVYKMRFTLDMEYPSRLAQFEIQGSTNGTTWQNLGTYTTLTDNALMVYTLINVADYNYYRLKLTSESGNGVTIKNLQYILYDVSMYVNSYTLDGAPAEWTRGQRLTIYTPSVSTLAVTENYLNDEKINTILQGGKRYELRYNGASFDAKEV